MRITRLELKNFRKFDHLDLDFDPGMNVVVGPNEQGKTTIVRALVAGLFYDPLKKAGIAVQDNQRWGSDKLYSVNLTFEADGEEYHLAKDFENKQLLLRGPAGAAWRTFPEVSEQLAKLSGLSTPTLYESSALVKQDRVAEIHSTKSELAKVLQELVTSGEEDVNALTVDNSLKREINRIKKGYDRDVKDPGPLRKLKDNVESLSEQFEVLSDQHADVSRRQKDMGALEDKKKKLQERHEALEKLIQDNRILLESAKELEAVTVVFKELDEKIREVEKLQAANEAAKKDQPNIEDVEKLEQAVREAGEKQAVIRALEKDLKKKKVPESYPGGRGKLGKVYFVISAVVAIVGAGGFFIAPWLYAFFVVTLIFAVLGITETYKRGDVMVEVSGAEKKSATDVTQAKNELSKILTAHGVESYEALEKKHEKMQSAHDVVRENELKVTALLRSDSLEQLEEKRQDVAAQKIGLEKQQKDLGLGKTVSPEELAASEAESERVRRELAEIERTLVANEAVVENVNVSAADIDVLKDDLHSAEQDYAKLQSRVYIYEKIRETLEVARNRTMSSVQDVLQSSIEQHLPAITAGRYSKVRVGENLEIEVFAEELGDFVNPKDTLSRGTIDQIYLIARFALATAQAEGKFPPIILDDPFVTFDATRKQAAAQLAKDFAKDFQVFLFTYSDEYSKMADKVIHLEEVI